LVNSARVRFDNKHTHPVICYPLPDNVKGELAALGQYSHLLYILIAQEGRKGIAKVELKKRVDQSNAFDKCIAKLEKRNLIKRFRTVHSKIAVYLILYDLEPEDAQTGGIWYENGDIDTKFVSTLTKCTYAMLKREGPCTLETIRDFLISSVEVKSFTIEHTKQIVDCLIADGKVEKMTGGTGYKLKYLTQESTDYLSHVPCAVCPVQHLCGKTSEITPQKCAYLNQWLMF